MPVKITGPSPVYKTNRYKSVEQDGPHDFSGSVIVFTENKTTVGSPVPGYKQKIQRREDASSAYSRTSCDLKSCTPLTITGRRQLTPFWSEIRKQTLDAEWYISAPIEGIVMNQSLTNVQTNAQTKFIKKAMATQQSLAGAVALGELGQTIKMIARPARSLRDGIERYLGNVKKRGRDARKRRGRLRGMEEPGVRKDVQRAVSGSYLEAVFGWMPLINDIEGGAQALARLGVNGGGRVERVAFRSEAQSIDSSMGSVGFADWGSGKFVRVTTTTVSVGYYGGVFVPYPRQSVSRLLGFQLTDFPATVWELIPFSFLADYFVNVGSLLESVKVLTCKFSYLGKTEKRKVECITGAAGVAINGDPTGKYLTNVMNCSGGNTTASKLVFSRTNITPTDLIPPLTFTVPGAGSKKWMNIAALGLQAQAVSRHIVR